MEFLSFLLDVYCYIFNREPTDELTTTSPATVNTTSSTNINYNVPEPSTTWPKYSNDTIVTNIVTVSNGQ